MRVGRLRRSPKGQEQGILEGIWLLVAAEQEQSGAEAGTVLPSTPCEGDAGPDVCLSKSQASPLTRVQGEGGTAADYPWSLKNTCMHAHTHAHIATHTHPYTDMSTWQGVGLLSMVSPPPLQRFSTPSPSPAH